MRLPVLNFTDRILYSILYTKQKYDYFMQKWDFLITSPWLSYIQQYSLHLQKKLGLFNHYFIDRDLSNVHIISISLENREQKKQVLTLVESSYIFIITADVQLEIESVPLSHEISVAILILDEVNVECVVKQPVQSAVKEKSEYTFFLGVDAQLQFFSLLFDTHTIDTTFICHLLGSGASAQMQGAYLLNDAQSATITTKQHHHGAHTSSNLLFKGFVTDNAVVSYQGTVIIENDAQHTQATQYNKNVVGSAHAQAKSVPSLEIKAHDVRCQHGSAIGQLDQQQLFYLQSRGYSYVLAQKILVESFFSNAIHESQKSIWDKKLHSLFS